VSVTDAQGRNLLHKALGKKELNQFGKHLVRTDNATNNYGELLALQYALRVAKKEKAKKIFGDSKLVIDYWSRRRAKRKELSIETIRLVDKVAKLREQFEEAGGSVERISGDDNPADLGFHR
jgi:ribonuclease HI